MRLRNIPRAESVLEACKEVVKNPESLCGHWNQEFQNERPLHIEIGMGKGQFLLTLAAENPQINYVGIERYSSVLLRGLQKRSEMDLENIYFMCIDAKDMAEIFAPGEVDRIYLNFSDPWPKDRHAKRRLTSPVFMSVYDKILAPRGVVEFKTDNRGLFEYSLESIPDAGWEITEYTFDLHNSPMAEGNVMTEYEMKFASEGKPICKLIARRTGTCGQGPA